tara:strand:+ start:446 stop:889 length:444 start_codon:yes stop_codon:yes gene_type:complete
MNKDSLEIFKKYSDKPSTKNSALVSIVDSYDPQEVSRDINDFNIELRKQKITCDKFDNSKEDMLEKCRLFIESNKSIIQQQIDQLHFLETELPKYILKNKENAETNSELNELLKSNEYIDITEKIRTIKSTINKLKSFLVDEGLHNF